MTYNFDPERWYEIELGALERRHGGGRISAGEFQRALEALDRRYEAMLKRLDGTYRVLGTD